MGSAPQPPTPRPTLDDLLRFKRAERPAPEFWAEFDRGLRQKQLAALMKRPQGWARFRPAFVRSLRWAVPATAAAAVALVVIQIPLTTASRNNPVEVASRPLGAEKAALQATSAVSSTSAEVVAAAPSSSPVVALAPTVAPSAPVAVPDVAASRERSLPWSTVAMAEAEIPARRPGEDLTVGTTEPAARRLRSSWGSRFNEMVQDLSIEETTGRSFQLASLALPAVNRSEPLFAAGAATPVSSPVSTRTRRSNERDFRDLESRFGVTGSSLSIKF